MAILNLIIGLGALIVAITAIVIQKQDRAEDRRIRAREREEENGARDHAAREARIKAVTERYVGRIPVDSGLGAALHAGVTELLDSAEVLEFVNRTGARASFDPVLPQSVRDRVANDQLLPFFKAVAATPNWRNGLAFENLLNEFSRPVIPSRRASGIVT